MPYLEVSFEIVREEQLQFGLAVPWLKASAQTDGGVLKHQVLHDLGNPSRFVYLSKADSREELDTHLNSERFQALTDAIKRHGRIIEAKIVSQDEVEKLNNALRIGDL